MNAKAIRLPGYPTKGSANKRGFSFIVTELQGKDKQYFDKCKHFNNLFS